MSVQVYPSVVIVEVFCDVCGEHFVRKQGADREEAVSLIRNIDKWIVVGEKAICQACQHTHNKVNAILEEDSHPPVFYLGKKIP